MARLLSKAAELQARYQRIAADVGELNEALRRKKDAAESKSWPSRVGNLGPLCLGKIWLTDDVNGEFYSQEVDRGWNSGLRSGKSSLHK